MAHWTVNSYGYPNPFSSQQRAQEAWETFELFLESEDYAEVKAKWITLNPNDSKAHGLESRKTAFEEFGMLYVISRSGRIVITPVGRQMIEAYQNADHTQFVWVGMNALLRYPLVGPPPPRRPKGESEQRASKLLPYAVLLAVIKDLGYLWREEFDHILSQAFTVTSVAEAIKSIRKLRAREETLENFPIEDENSSHYNMMTQLIVHGSMNYDLIVSSNDEVFYSNKGRELKYFINPKWMHLVDKALGENAIPNECFVSKSFVSRMPTSLTFNSEQEYFDYLGATVGAETISAISNPLPTANMDGSRIPVLREGTDYHLVNQLTIRGSVEHFCQIPIDQRIIASHNTERTFIVVDKLRDSNDIVLKLRLAKYYNLNPAIKNIFNNE